jgi:hypothetical protein
MLHFIFTVTHGRSEEEYVVNVIGCEFSVISVFS